MSNPPEVPTDWDMWEDVEGSLEKEKKNRFLPIFLGLPFLLAAAGYIGFLLAPNPAVFLSNQVETIRDTIYITNTINSVDTIVKKEFITQYRYRNSEYNQKLQRQVRNLAELNQSLQNSISSLDNKLDDYRIAFSESAINSNLKYAHLDIFNDGITIDKNKLETTTSDRSTLENLALSPSIYPQALDFNRPKLIIVHDPWLENLIKNKKSESVVEQIIPDYVNLGISIETPSLSITDRLSPALESGIGLHSEFLFSSRFSLVTGIRKRSTQNKTTDLAIALTYPQPIVTPDETFKNLKVKASFIDIPVISKYKAFKHLQNDVYLVGGLLLSKRQETEYVYEYIRNTSEIYYEEKEGGGNWNLGSVIFGVGYEFDAWKNTTAFVETNARYNFKSDFAAVHGVGFRFGVFYKI